MNHFKLIFLLSLTLALTTGCKTSQRTGRTGKLKKSPAAYVLTRMQTIEADWFEGRAQIAYDDGSFSVKTTATIRMRRDSLVWISVKKLGIEMARLQITRDSVYVLDRINNQYVAEDLRLLEQEYNLPADLAMLQAVILGNPIFLLPRQNLQSEVREPTYHLFGKDQRVECQYWINGLDFLLQKMAIDEFNAGRRLQITQENYRQVADNQNFSYFRRLEMNSKETGSLSIGIDFSKVELNVPKSIRFDIPSRYTRAQYD